MCTLRKFVYHYTSLKKKEEEDDDDNDDEEDLNAIHFV